MKGPESSLELQQLSTMTDIMNWLMTYMTPLNQCRKNILMRLLRSGSSHGNKTEMLMTKATSRSIVASCGVSRRHTFRSRKREYGRGALVWVMGIFLGEKSSCLHTQLYKTLRR